MHDEPDAEEDEARAPVVVPHQELSSAALRGVIEAFVLREGTDYGEYSHSLADKVQQVERQILRGEAEIVFDPVTESVDIVPVRPRGRVR